MNLPVKVVHVVGGAEVGGTERQVLLLLEHLDPSRVLSEVLLIRSGPLLPRFEALAPTTVLPKRRKLDPIFTWRLGRRIRSQKPDVVHTWGSTANLWGTVAAAIARQRRVVVADRALDEWKGLTLRGLDRFVYRRATLITGNSEAVRAASIARGAVASRTSVIPNGVAVPPVVATERDQGLVLCPGRLDPRKGQDVLIAAVPLVGAACPDVRVVLAGPAVHPFEVEYARALRAQIEGLGLAGRVELRGPVADLAPLYGAASVVVVPSRSEGSPNAVLEALGHAAGVVASAAGGIPEVVTDGETGWLVPPEDSAQLAAAIVEVLSSPAEARRRGMAGRAMVEQRFAAASVAAQWMKVYEQVAGDLVPGR